MLSLVKLNTKMPCNGIETKEREKKKNQLLWHALKLFDINFGLL